jgi:C-terminal processing protease CtpA/Prc
MLVGTLLMAPLAIARADDDQGRSDKAPQANSQRTQDQQSGQQAAEDDEETEYRGLEHASLGVMLSERSGKGVRISDLLPGSPAQRAGLRAGDRITKLAEKPVKSYADVIRFINRAQPGQTAKVTINRDGQEKTVQVTLASREQLYGDQDQNSPDDSQRQFRFGNQRMRQQDGQQNQYGGYAQGNRGGRRDNYDSSQGQNLGGRRDQQYLTQERERTFQGGQQQGGQQNHEQPGVLGIDLENQRDAAVIANTWPGSPAEQAGLRRGDEITAIDGQEVRDQNSLMQELQEYDPGDRLRLTIVRNGQEQTVRVRLGQQSDLLGRDRRTQNSNRYQQRYRGNDSEQPQRGEGFRFGRP